MAKLKGRTPSLLLLVSCRLAIASAGVGVSSESKDTLQLNHTAAIKSEEKAEWYFWNEITGETQWEDPGDVPYEDENANRYWLTPTGDRLGYDPNADRYTWVENWSEEHQRPFYYNQKTKESKWEKPVDLAWRRVKGRDTGEL